MVRVWVAHIEAHLDHMAVFAQERHSIEHEPEWEDVRASRDAFEAILARRLAEVGITDRLQHFALLGMVNHTATWLKPGGRLTARADRRRLLRPDPRVIRPATPHDERALRALDRRNWSRSCTAPSLRADRPVRHRRRPRRRLEGELAGYVKLGPRVADPGRRPRTRAQGPHGRRRVPAPRGRPRAARRGDRARPGRGRAQAHPARARPQRRPRAPSTPRPASSKRATCAGSSTSKAAYVDDVLMVDPRFRRPTASGAPCSSRDRAGRARRRAQADAARTAATTSRPARSTPPAASQSKAWPARAVLPRRRLRGRRPARARPHSRRLVSVAVKSPASNRTR